VADGHLAGAEGAGDAGRAVAHDVQGAEPEAGTAGVDAGAAQHPAVHLGQCPSGRRGWLVAAGGDVVDGGRDQTGGGRD
jgi:hypothetical protein